MWKVREGVQQVSDLTWRARCSHPCHGREDTLSADMLSGCSGQITLVCGAGILKELQQSKQARMEEVHLTRSAWLAILGSRGHPPGSGTKKS